MAQELVSIITPAFNEEALIGEFVDRIVRNINSLDKLYEFEITLFDDDSSGSSLRVMRDMIGRYPGVSDEVQ